MELKRTKTYTIKVDDNNKNIITESDNNSIDEISQNKLDDFLSSLKDETEQSFDNNKLDRDIIKNDNINDIEEDYQNEETEEDVDFKEKSFWICESITCCACAAQAKVMFTIDEFKEKTALGLALKRKRKEGK